MVRKYAAFISYRHRPLDIAVAKKIHRSIERYTIPKDLRKNGEKRLGLVFRDREELPLSSNLTDDIFTALDNSEFLIVVCTPDTPDSLWCRREIRHFIEKHGRERVITVLASGTPEESVPREITTVFAEDGETVLEQYEPLCAYLADKSERKVLRNLDKELLRLYAAMLNCPYDALRQRHKRQKIQLILAATSLAFAVALVFIAMLASKNRTISQMNEQIRQQLLESQRNESQALALNSRTLLKDNNRRGAVESALAALPTSEKDRPYVAEAHAALADALYLYQSGQYRIDAHTRQYETIADISLSPDGRYAITLTEDTKIRCYDLFSQQELWSFSHPDSSSHPHFVHYEPVFFCRDGKSLILMGGEIVYRLSLETGQVLLEIPVGSDNYLLTVSPDESTLAGSGTQNTSFFDLSDGRKRDTIRTEGYPSSCAFSEDAAAFVLLNENGIFFTDIQTGKTIRYDIPLEDSYYFYDCTVSFLPGEGFVVGFADINLSYYYLFSPQGEPLDVFLMGNTDIDYEAEFEEVISHNTGGYWEFFGRLVDTHVAENGIFYVYDDFYRFLQLEDGKISVLSREHSTPRTVCSFLRNGSLFCLNTSGSFTEYTDPVTASPNSLRYDLPDFDFCSHICASGNNGSVIALLCGKEAIFLRHTGGADLDAPKQIPGKHISYQDTQTYVSPSGKYLVVQTYAGFDPIYDLEEGRCLDTQLAFEGSVELDGNRIYLEGYHSVLGFTAEETCLAFTGGRFLDLTTGELSLPEGYENVENSAFCFASPRQQRMGAPVMFARADKSTMTLHWWADGKDHQSCAIPGVDPETDSIQLELGHNGLILCTVTPSGEEAQKKTFLVCSLEEGSWKTLENPVPEVYNRFCMGTSQPVFLFTGDENMLYRYDYSENAITAKFPLPFPEDNLDQMYLICQDTVLLVTSIDGSTICLLDAVTGQVLRQLQYPRADWYNELFFREIPDRNTLILAGQVLDTQTWTTLYTVPGVVGYQESTHSFVCENGDFLTLWPDYTVRELTEKAQALLAGKLYE